MIAVITGDIVASSRVPGPERAALLAKLEHNLRGLDPPPLGHQIFRGDAFQLALREPQRGLRAALRLALTLLLPGSPPSPGVALRLGLGIGDVAHAGHEGDIGRWSGEAFERAGAALDGLASRRLALRSPWPELDAEFGVSLPLLSALMRRWTSEQHEVILAALAGRSQGEIAADLGVSQSAVSQRLKLAGWDAIGPLLERFEGRVALGLDGHLFEEGD